MYLELTKCAGIVLRYAQEDIRLPQTAGERSAAVVPAGSLVAVSPYLAHHDARFFARPDTYNPARHLRKQHASPPAVHRAAATYASCPVSDDAKEVSRQHCSAASQSGADPDPVHVAFGAGTFRCPGRAFARQQLRTAVAAFFTACNAALAPQDLCASHSGPSHGQPESSKQHGLAAGQRVPSWLQQDATPGGHIMCRGMRSGDAAGVLPQAQSQLLVGVKRPQGLLWASCRLHTASSTT